MRNTQEGARMGQDKNRHSGLALLAERIARLAPYDGGFEMRLPGLHLYRISKATKELHHGVQKPGLCLVAQGAKSVMVDKDLFEYDENRLLVYSVDMPVASRVVRASSEAPYLSMRLDLDPQRIAELLPKVHPRGAPNAGQDLAITVIPSDPDLVEAASRLLALMTNSGDAELLAPLVVDEILIRLLRGPMGARVAQIGSDDSRLQRVGKAVAWLREHYDQAVEIEALAGMVHMSASTFHQHFKSVTSMSPLQYQKTLRLQEARRLMLSSPVDAGAASRRVGYASPSQFTREYGRYFGNSPAKDISRLRELSVVGAPPED